MENNNKIMETEPNLSKKQLKLLAKVKKQEAKEIVVEYSDIDYESIVDKENIIIASKLTKPIEIKFLDVGKIKKVISNKNVFEIYEYKILFLEKNQFATLNVSSNRLFQLIKTKVMEKKLVDCSFILIRHTDVLIATNTYYELIPLDIKKEKTTK